MTYEEYEEMKIQEAVEIAEGIMAGKIKTISFEELKKQIDELMENIIKEKNHKWILFKTFKFKNLSKNVSSN